MSVIRLAVMMAAFSTTSFADRVERRGDAGVIEGTVTRVGEDGVEIATDLDARHTIPWDRIRSVDSSRHAAMVTSMMPVAETLWRARSRVERGDMTLAEPLFERLFERFRGRNSETALVVAEGLLRCRLARGDQALAVIAALEVTRLRRLGIQTDSYAALAPVFDVDTQLCPLLPPLLPQGPGLQRLREQSFENSDPVVRAIAAAYAAAPTVDRDGTLSPATSLSSIDEHATEHAGVRLITAIVRAGERHEERGGRIAAMLALAPQAPGFAEPWIQAAHAHALIDDETPSTARRGVVRLLRIPAANTRRQPWLAGTALLIAAATEARIGDPAVADLLRRDLLARFPYHPLVATPLRRHRVTEEIQ